MQDGYLTVQTFLSAESYGVEGVKVTLSDGRVLYTDENGFTETVVIEAPNKETGLKPDMGTPYTSIDITARKEGFFTIVLKNVQIFPTETTLQKIQMLPIPENGGGGEIIYTMPPQNL